MFVIYVCFGTVVLIHDAWSLNIVLIMMSLQHIACHICLQTGGAKLHGSGITADRAPHDVFGGRLQKVRGSEFSPLSCTQDPLSDITFGPPATRPLST